MSEPPQKRFRYETYNEKLGKVSVDVGKRKGLSWEKEEFGEEEQTKTPFTIELARLELQDLTIPYQDLARALHPLTRTLPITLLNLEPIFDTFAAFFAKLSNGENHIDSGLDSALFLIQALYETCLGEAVQYVPLTVKHLVRVGALRALEPRLIERTYSTISLMLRAISPTLLKAEHEAILRSAWFEVRAYLSPQNKPYVRKCIADAWAGVLRKARGDALRRLMSVLVEDATPGMEAVWANAMKGTSHHLHSRGLPIFQVLLEELNTNPDDRQVVIVRNVITALVHHCSSSETGPLVDSVLARVDLVDAKAASSSKKPQATRFPQSTAFLELLEAFLFTRKGKRFPSSQLKPTMNKLQGLVPQLGENAADSEDLDEETRALHSRWRQALVAAIVGSLNAGHLAEWLSPGVALIDKLWQALSTEEAFAFANMCIGFKWAGVEQFLLAHVTRSALAGLVSNPLPTLVLLNNLASNGFLSGGLSNVQGGRWRTALVTALGKLLQKLQDSSMDEDERRVLGQVLQLLPHLAGESQHFSGHLLNILRQLVANEEETNEENWREEGVWNGSHVVGRLLTCLYQLVLRGPSSVQDEIKEVFHNEDLANTLISRWHWNREVLAQAAEFAEHWSLTISPENAQAILPNLISSDSGLRLSTIRLMIVQTKPASEEAAKIWETAKQVESAEMSLKNVRERTEKIARLGRHLTSLSADVAEAEAATINSVIIHMIAQLKINFKPVWSETITTLTALVGKYTETIWTNVWSELEKTIAVDETVVPDLGVISPSWTLQKVVDEEEEEVADEDAEFRCPGFLKARIAVSRAWKQNSEMINLDIVEITPQISRDRLDVLSYESQLLGVLTATPSMAEKHTRVVVPVALAIAGASEDESVALSHLSTRQLQNRTINFLELLAKFVNPKAAFRSAELHTLYLDLLSKGEPKVQGVALRCLLTYKSPNLMPYRERLSSLLEDAKFRDELAHFELGVDSEVVEPQHRQELLDVTIRLLYGIMMSRRARSSTAQGQGARKQAVLSSLNGCSSAELGTLVDLMLQPFGGLKHVTAENLSSVSIVAPGRQQLGYLTFLHDVLRYLAPQTVEHWPRLLGATITLVRQAQVSIDNEKDPNEEEEDVDEEEEVEDKGAVPLRSVRSMGLKRLVQFLRSNATEFDVSPYLKEIFSSIISPRLSRLEIENTQAPSGTLDLIAALAANPDTAKSLVEFDDRALPKTFACLTAVKVKPAVIGRVFDVIDSLLADEESDVVENVLMVHIRPLIDNIIGLVQNLRSSANDDIMRRLLAILSRLSAVVTDNEQAQQLASLLGPMLRQPGRQVSEKAKVNILVTLQKLYAISPDFKQPTSTFFSQNYNIISNLFQTLHFPTSRRALVGALQTFADADESLAPVVAIVADLNAYRVKRMDEPDFDKRLDAFSKLIDASTEELPQTAREWLPLLRNSLHFIQEAEELSIRTNSSSVLQRFIDMVGIAEEGPFVDTLQTVILPSLRRILLSKHELVRNEVLLVFSHAVRTCPGLPVLAEMRPLLGDDDETNIFSNFSHIQLHRRARAIRRLREICSEGGIRETTLSSVFIPVLEHILAGATDVQDHHLVNEAIITIGGLAGQFSWSRYNALIMRYLKLGTPTNSQQKFYIRAVTSVIDNFHFDLKGGAQVGQTEVEEEEAVEVVAVTTTDPATDAAAEQPQEELPEMEVPEVAPSPTERITNVVLTRLLPKLSNFITTKSETEDSVRIPIALSIVKVASALPDEASEHEILRTITTASQILRSKDQDIRDIARDTIGKIAVYLGPSWLSRVLKELRTALQRGPQKHVLAVTTHSILVYATTEAKDRFSDLDAAVSDAVEVAAEVIWGESGKDVATDGFKTKMREVRGALSRGNDTFQLVARLVSPGKVSALLEPVREIMHVSQAVKTMLQVDEVLRRIALGLNSNPMVGPQDILTLSHSLINGNSAYLRPKRKAPKSAKVDRFHVQMKRNVKEDEDVYPQNAHKFVTFGLELFVTAFRRGKFDFEDVDILSRLGPLVNAIGNTLYSPESSIIILGLKATAAIAKCPVPQVDEALPAFVNNIFKIIKHAGGTAESETAQTALKTLAVLLRDCPAAQVSDAQLKYLIEVISPDLEDHERQSCLFTILRAVVARKFVVPEIYDLMDRVSSIMVTSQSTHVQELSRGVLMQFLLDYPQGKGRLKAQMTFLARNLDYVFEAGRMSVMEVLSAVFRKFSPELVAEYADLFMVALVAVIANDDSEKCRNMAGVLLQQLYTLLTEEHQQRTLAVLSGWIEARDDNSALAGAALAVYGLLCEAAAEDDSDSETFASLPTLLNPVLVDSAKALLRAEASDDFEASELEATLPQQALSVAAKALKASPASASTLPWDAISTLLLFPHEWVRFGAARAISLVLVAGDVEHIPSLLDVARKCCILLGGSKDADGDDVVVDAKLADQIVKVLWNVAKYWGKQDDSKSTSNGTAANPEEDVEAAAEDDDAADESPTRALSWLMSRMSFLARHLIVHRPASNTHLPGQPFPWIGPVSAILRFFAGTFESLTRLQCKRYITHILSPVFRILDEGGDLAGLEKHDGSGLDELKTLATEVREFVQTKVGATEFSRAWETLRRRVGERREVRREQRVRMAVQDPQAWARRSEKRGERKKDSKKRKVHAFMDQKRARPRRA